MTDECGEIVFLMKNFLLAMFLPAFALPLMAEELQGQALLAAESGPFRAEKPLEAKIREIADAADAQVGVALIIDGKDTLAVDGGGRYPLMSVMKFHQSVALLRYMDICGTGLDHELEIDKRDLLPDIWSPLRDEFPEGTVMTVAELLRYTLQMSDNNACDILFDRFLDPHATDSTLRSLGLDGFAIDSTEDEMHRDPNRCFDNWTTPLSAAALMDRLAAGTLPVADAESLKEILLGCRTGEGRLPSPLKGTSARIGHKTGTSDVDDNGRWTAVNDVGFVQLPDGRRYSIAVMVKDSGLGFEATEKIIADISAAVYEALRRPGEL